MTRNRHWPVTSDGSSKGVKVYLRGRYSNRVEVLGRYLNHSDQGERLRTLLKVVPSGYKTAKTRTPRRVCRRLEPAKVEELIQGYVGGVLVADLADQFCVDQSTVHKHARRHGLPRRSPRLGPGQIEAAARLYVAGQSLAKLSGHFGVAADAVTLALRRAGVTLRPRRGWPRYVGIRDGGLFTQQLERGDRALLNLCVSVGRCRSVRLGE